MTTTPDFELIEFHDADLQRMTLEATRIVLEFSNFSVYVRETDSTQGIWLHDARLVAGSVTEIELKSRLGLGDEADSIYSASFSSLGQLIETSVLVRGAVDCECTFQWAISGTALRFRASSVELQIGQRIRRLGTWDLTTQRMRE
jgi:hypothetical protein